MSYFTGGVADMLQYGTDAKINGSVQKSTGKVSFTIQVINASKITTSFTFSGMVCGADRGRTPPARKSVHSLTHTSPLQLRIVTTSSAASFRSPTRPLRTTLQMRADGVLSGSFNASEIARAGSGMFGTFQLQVRSRPTAAYVQPAHSARIRTFCVHAVCVRVCVCSKRTTRARTSRRASARSCALLRKSRSNCGRYGLLHGGDSTRVHACLFMCEDWCVCVLMLERTSTLLVTIQSVARARAAQHTNTHSAHTCDRTTAPCTGTLNVSVRCM